MWFFVWSTSARYDVHKWDIDGCRDFPRHWLEKGGASRNQRNMQGASGCFQNLSMRPPASFKRAEDLVNLAKPQNHRTRDPHEGHVIALNFAGNVDVVSSGLCISGIWVESKLMRMDFIWKFNLAPIQAPSMRPASPSTYPIYVGPWQKEWDRMVLQNRSNILRLRQLRDLIPMIFHNSGSLQLPILKGSTQRKTRLNQLPPNVIG